MRTWRNKPNVAKPAIAAGLHAGSQWRGLADAARYAELRAMNTPPALKATARWTRACGGIAVVLLFLVTGGLHAQNFNYTNIGGTVTITRYIGPGGTAVIPSTIEGLPVTGIGDLAFFSQIGVTNVTIPDSVTFIGISAFYGCSSLQAVIIPNSVTNLGQQAFCGCLSLASVTLGNGITRIEGGGSGNFFGTFESCVSLSRVEIPDSVTTISDGALDRGGSLGAFFYCTSLTNVFIGKGLTYLGVGTFSGCTNLVSVYFQSNAPTAGYDMSAQNIFSNGTVYYLPGTTGWSSTYVGRPTMLWNPEAQTTDGSFGVRQNQFGFNIAGTADIPVVIEASAGLAGDSWIPLQTCTLTNGLLYFSDPQWKNYPERFYRIRSP